MSNPCLLNLTVSDLQPCKYTSMCKTFSYQCLINLHWLVHNKYILCLIWENKWKSRSFTNGHLGQTTDVFSVLCVRCCRNVKNYFSFCIPEVLTFAQMHASATATREPVMFLNFGSAAAGSRALKGRTTVAAEYERNCQVLRYGRAVHFIGPSKALLMRLQFPYACQDCDGVTGGNRWRLSSAGDTAAEEATSQWLLPWVKGGRGSCNMREVALDFSRQQE